MVFLNSNAQNCDSLKRKIKSAKLHIDDGEYNKELFSNVDKRCFLEILDSLNEKNVDKNLDFIRCYYSYFRPPMSKVITDDIDSTIATIMSYRIADTNQYIASSFRAYATLGRSYLWVLRQNEKSRQVLRKFILSQKTEIDWIWIEYACKIKDTVSFWHGYNITKNNEKSNNYSMNLNFMIDFGMTYFGYNYLFERNLDELMRLNTEGISYTIYDSLPSKVGFKNAKKIYNRVVQNKKFMQQTSLGLTQYDESSIFNKCFIRGIEVFYPELLKSKEYLNHRQCLCTFDKNLYNLLIKTIKKGK
jgi:hypothetical protein